MLQGIVKWFNTDKGFGYITETESKKDYFIHWQNIQGNGFRFFLMGDVVEFDTEDTPKGRMAINAKKVGVKVSSSSKDNSNL